MLYTIVVGCDENYCHNSFMRGNYDDIVFILNLKTVIFIFFVSKYQVNNKIQKHIDSNLRLQKKKFYQFHTILKSTNN